MKEIKAYVRPERAGAVIQALEDVGINGMTVIDVTALAEWADPRRTRFSLTHAKRYSRTVKLELICPAGRVNTITEAIRVAGHTGNPGDGKIFIADIDDAISIRTGERGQAAI